MPELGEREWCWRLAAVAALSVLSAGCSDDVWLDLSCEPEPPAVVPGEVSACGATLLYDNPSDPAARGAWPVGARTVSVDGLVTEVWYPAVLGSEPCGERKRYDLREWLPESEKGKIPDADTLPQDCDCYTDLPIDGQHGPYPVVVFIHGTAGFRTQSLEHMVHWASRGFVVIAADHPGLYLGDALELKLVRDLPGDIDKIFAALAAGAGPLGFLGDHVDLERMAMSGHSAGGAAVQDAGSRAGVRVVIPLAAGGTSAGPNLESTLVVGGLADQVVAFSKTEQGYLGSPKKKRLVGLSKAGHLFPTDLCWLHNSQGKNMLEVATQYEIKNAGLASVLFDCPADQLPRDEARAIVNFASSAALEETLHCAGGDPFSDIEARFPAVGDFRQEL